MSWISIFFLQSAQQDELDLRTLTSYVSLVVGCWMWSKPQKDVIMGVK